MNEGYAVAGVLVVLALGAATRYLETHVPHRAEGTAFERVVKSIAGARNRFGTTGHPCAIEAGAARRAVGWRPIAVFASAAVVNIVVALGLAAVLFGNFQSG